MNGLGVMGLNELYRGVCPLVSVSCVWRWGKRKKKEAKREEQKERSWHTKEARGFRVQSFWQRDHYHLIQGEWELNVSSVSDLLA